MRSWKWQGVNHVFLCDCDRLVSGAGDIKLTKDGNVLLHEMVNYLADYSFIVKVFIEIDKMYWLFAGSISRILWCLEPIRPATVNCRFILTSFYLFTRKLCQKATIFFWRKKNSAEINLLTYTIMPLNLWKIGKKRSKCLCIYNIFTSKSGWCSLFKEHGTNENENRWHY